MLALFFLGGSIIMGIGVIRRITRDLLDEVEQFFWGLLVGWVVTALVVYLVARWQGQLTHSQVLSETISIWIVAATIMALDIRSGRFQLSRFRWRRYYSGLLLVLIIFTPIYWRLLSIQFFPHGEGGIYSGSADNDLAFHAALTSSFAYGKNFPPAYTLLPPDSLFYPYLPDFQAAVLLTAGLSLRTAFIIVALILGLVTVGLFYSFAQRIARSPTTATVATVLFLLNGGFGFIYFFRDWWQSGKSFLAFFNNLHTNYAMISERGLHWTNLMSGIMVPQRTSLFGLPLAIIIFSIFAIIWQRWHGSNGEKKSSTPGDLTLMTLAGVLSGALTLFHTHTFIAVGLVSIGLFILKPRREWIVFWALAVFLSAPQLLPLAGRAGGIVRFFPGWLGYSERFFPLYLLRNLGLPLLLALPAWWAAEGIWRKFYLAFLVPLAFCFVVVVSPNLYDNGKLIYYWHALNSVLVAAWLVHLATVPRQRLIALFLGIVCVSTALLVFRSDSLSSSRMFSDEELNAAAFVRDHTGPRSLFLTAPTLRQPVLSFAGRPVVRSATAWLWSHGYEFREREADVRRIYAGTVDAVELLRYYHVDYIYFGDAERGSLKADESFFDRNFSVIYRSPTITIYDAHKSRPGSLELEEPHAITLAAPAPRELAPRLDQDPYALIVEFPRTSFFVYRLLRASSGRMPRRDEFMKAMTVIGRGLKIGETGWQDQLENNRNALLNDWTNNGQFAQLHNGKTNADFVTSLVKSAGLNWTVGKRDELINALDTGSVSRASALLQITEDKDFYSREYNTAYVLVHYFGYLRRNPDDPPDGDLHGLIFWRNVLDRLGDYRTLSLAFMESSEYNNLPPPP